MLLGSVMLLLLLQLFFLLPPAYTFSPSLLQKPADCAETTSLLVLVHSSPDHRALRQTLRETWARNRVGHIRTVFVVGDPKNKKLTEALRQEGEQQGDLLQGDFVDSYRNLTTKHLFAFTWAAFQCDRD